MSTDRYRVSGVTVFVVLIAFGGGLAAQSAGQAGSQINDPSGIALKRDASGPAPGAAPGTPTPVKVSGKVGPGGKVLGQNSPSSPDGPASVKDPAIERLGPGGVGGKAPIEERLGPGGLSGKGPIDERLGPAGPVNEKPTSQALGPGVVKPGQPGKNASPPAKQVGQQPAKKPDATSKVNEPVANRGLRVFIDPTTGAVTQPTDGQLQDVGQQQAVLGDVEVTERPAAVVGGGMIANVPTALRPEVMATKGADGKVNLEERQAGATAALSHGPKLEQQSGQSAAAQGLGPAGDQHVDLPEAAGDVTVTIVNLDAAGEGFNDPTGVAPVFGNRGTTRGAQRLNVFRAAAEYWGGILKSPIPIRVDAAMDSQFCTATSAVLGSAGPNTVHRDFTGAPAASTWYVQAVANSRAGADLDAGFSDIGATFNSDVDNAACLGSTSWWYGIGAPAPAGTIDFYTVVLHEIGHGIGVLSLVNLGTGAKFLGFNDAYMAWLWDWNTGGWPGMTNAQRIASGVNTGQVIFWGPRATEAARGVQSAGNNGGYPRVYAPNPVQGGSSISHFDNVLTPNELMEPAITAPPGPYAYLTGGLLQDVGWDLLANGVFDYGAVGTWTWNPTDGWFQPTTADPTRLEPWNGNFVGIYASGTWLWNGTTRSWSLLTSAITNNVKACGNNLLWASPAYGTWRWSASTGWDQLASGSPDRLDCFGGDAAWEGADGTWLYNFSTAGGPGTGGWLLLTTANPTGIVPCGSKLVWWRAGGGGDTWTWDAVAGWTYLTIGPETTACYRGQLAWEGPAGPGTWLYNFTTSSWTQITSADPEQILPWGPSLVWESAASGTWIWDGAWTQITSANPTLIEVLGADLFWSYPSGTWVWRGGAGGAGWIEITSAVPTQIVGTGAVR